jgi:DNA-binding MarR family transcriptional regulator
MSIENDIQSRFRSEHHKIMVNLIYTYNWAMEKSKRFFENADLTPQQFNILRILRGAGKPLSTMQIRQRMLDRMSDTSRIVDRLLKKELVLKVVCKDDRRLVDITISEKGMKLLQDLDNYNDEMDAVLSAINEEEAKTLNQLLDKLRGSM